MLKQRMKQTCAAICVGTCCMFMATSPCTADEVVLQADKDTFVWKTNPDTSYCGELYMMVGKTDDSNGDLYMYYNWNIAGQFENPVHINEAWIELKQLGTSNTPNSVDVEIWRLWNSWNECFNGWNDRPNLTEELCEHTLPGLSSGFEWREIHDSSITDWVQRVVNNEISNQGIGFLPKSPVTGDYLYFESRSGSVRANLHIDYDVVADPPDISIESIWTEPENPREGEEFQLYVDFCNEGGSDADDIIIHYFINGDPGPEDSQYLLVPGDCEVENEPWTLDFCDDFEYTVEILPVAGEEDLSDNTMTITVYMDCPQFAPDISVDEVWTIPADPCAGEEVELWATVSNIGDATATDVFALFQIDGVDEEVELLGDMEPGDEWTGFVTYIFDSAQSYEYCVECLPVQDEENLVNNALCMTVDVTECLSLTITEPIPGLCGQTNFIEASNGTPYEKVYFIYGLSGGSASVPGCSGVYVDINNPKVIDSDFANSTGQSDIDFFVPPAACGVTVWFQAVEHATCTVSNLVIFTF